MTRSWIAWARPIKAASDSESASAHEANAKIAQSSADLKEGVKAGESITFILNVTNNGNAKDYVSVPSATAPSGWITTFSASQCTVDPSKSCVFYLTVNVPETVYGGDNVIHVKVFSDQSGQTIEMDFERNWADLGSALSEIGGAVATVCL